MIISGGGITEANAGKATEGWTERTCECGAGDYFDAWGKEEETLSYGIAFCTIFSVSFPSTIPFCSRFSSWKVTSKILKPAVTLEHAEVGDTEI